MGIEIGHQLFHWFTDLWINFLPRKFWRERLLSGANKPRRDFPDFRSVLPGLWERWAHSLLLECLPHLFPCFPARACWFHAQCTRDSTRHSGNVASTQSPRTTESLHLIPSTFSLNWVWSQFCFLSVSPSPKSSDTSARLIWWRNPVCHLCHSFTCCTIATCKRASDGHPEDLGLQVFPFCCPGARR